MINCFQTKKTVSIEFCQEKPFIFGNLMKMLRSILFHSRQKNKTKNLKKETLVLVFMLVDFKEL